MHMLPLCTNKKMKATSRRAFSLLIFTLSYGFLTHAQEPAAITCNSQVYYERDIATYTAVILIAEDLAYNSYNEPVSLATLKANYFKKLRLKNINTELLKGDPMAFALLGYRKKGCVFLVETANRDLYLDLLSISSEGVQVNEKYVYFHPLTPDEIRDLSTKALHQAREQAKLIAGAADKKVGEVLAINAYREELKRRFYTTSDVQEHAMSLTVKFAIN